MLVLSRNNNTSVLIGDDVRITIVNIGRNQVKLAIEAPDDVLILREELLQHESKSR